MHDGALDTDSEGNLGNKEWPWNGEDGKNETPPDGCRTALSLTGMVSAETGSHDEASHLSATDPCLLQGVASLPTNLLSADAPLTGLGRLYSRTFDDTRCAMLRAFHMFIRHASRGLAEETADATHSVMRQMVALVRGDDP